jgi:hypothetical protein
VLAALTATAVVASVARADSPSIYVCFLPTSTLRVVLADGTPLGTSSAAPTVIPPGSYNLLLDDSSLVSDVTFDLVGPNVKRRLRSLPLEEPTRSSTPPACGSGPPP